MTSPYVCSFSAWHPYSNGEWQKCKITCDICLELLLHSLYGCQGLLNSQLSKKAKRDTTQMAKMTRIISHKWSRITKKKCCVYKARTHSLTTFGLPAFDKLFIIHFSSSWNSFCPYAWYAPRNLFSKRPGIVVALPYSCMDLIHGQLRGWSVVYVGNKKERRNSAMTTNVVKFRTLMTDGTF